MLVCEHTVLLATTLHAVPEREVLVMLNLEGLGKESFIKLLVFTLC